MAKVTSKLQLTIPKALATQFGIRPGDEVTFEAAGDVIRIRPGPLPARARLDRETRLRLLSEADARFLAAVTSPTDEMIDRGWTREDLYEERLRWPRF